MKYVPRGDNPKLELTLRECIPAEPEPPAPAPRITVAERLHRLFEHSTLLNLLGVVGGLVGTFLDGRYFAVLCFWFVYGIHRSKSLQGLSKIPVTLLYIGATLGTAAGLFYMGIRINEARPTIYTPAQYLAAVKAGTPLPIQQQITNIYNPRSLLPITEALKEPRVDLSPFLTDPGDVHHLHYHSGAVNNGTGVALGVVATTKGYFLPKSEKSEAQIFTELRKRAFDEDAPRADMPPGAAYAAFEPLVVTAPTPAEMTDLMSQKIVPYLARVDTYKDSHGIYYASELCQWILPNLVFRNCDNHNQAIKLGSRKNSLTTNSEKARRSFVG